MAIRSLLDWNLVAWKQPTVFSLDLMKLSHYYKVYEHDLVYMLQEYSSENYTSVMINKDYEDYNYPEHIMRDPKASYCGLAISNGIYKPMDLLIENRPADTSIYNNMLKYYKRTTEAKSIFKHMMEGCHVRVSLDNRKANPKWDSQIVPPTGRVQHVIFHDKDITSLKGTDEVIATLLDYYTPEKARFGFKYPVDIYTRNDLIRWSRLRKSVGINNLYVHDIMDDAALNSITGAKQQLTYIINNRYWTLPKFLNELPHILIQGIFLSKHSIPILLKIEQDFLVEEEWRKVADFFNAYMKSCIMYQRDLIFSGFTYCKYAYMPLQKEEKVAMFKFIRDRQREFFDLLYSIEYATFEDNHFVPHMYTWGEIETGGGYGSYHYRFNKREKERRRTPIEQLYTELPVPEYLYLEREVINDTTRDLRKGSSE